LRERTHAATMVLGVYMGIGIPNPRTLGILVSEWKL